MEHYSLKWEKLKEWIAECRKEERWNVSVFSIEEKMREIEKGD